MKDLTYAHWLFYIENIQAKNSRMAVTDAEKVSISLSKHQLTYLFQAESQDFWVPWPQEFKRNFLTSSGISIVW